MATITRCDECKKLSDEPGLGYIGREFEVMKFRDRQLIIRVMGRDLCQTCIRNIVANNNLCKSGEDED